MSGERIGNSNQYLTISGVVSAPAYSWASDNDTGLYRIGANNIGIAASGTKVLDISTTAVTITPATTLSAALTYGGITLSNAVTGTGNMVLSASPTLTGTLTAAALTTSGTVAINSNANSLQTVVLQNTNAGAAAVTGLTVRNSSSYDLALQSLSAAFPPSGFYRAGGQIIYATAVGGLTLVTGTASGQPIYFYPGETLSLTLAASGAATFASTIASGAITSTGAVTGTRLMIGADSGASYLLNVSGSSTSTGVRAIVINTSNNAGAVTLLQVQNDATYALQMKIYSSTSASPNVGEIRCDGGNLTLGGQNTVGLTLGTSGAATFASSVTATLFTPTATGSNGLGLKGSNNPALYASATELANWTTTAFNILKDTAVTGGLTATTMSTSDGSTSSMINGATETIISLATGSNIVLVVIRWVSGANYAAAICVRCGSNYEILNIGTTSGLTLIGGNGIIQVTNSSGATRSFSWTAIRMA